MQSAAAVLAVCAAFAAACAFAAPAPLPGESGAEAGSGLVYGVVEIPFTGPECGPTDAPARDIVLAARFRHEGGGPDIVVHGFWDGDGAGGPRGNVFKVRFCPVKPGRWTLVEVSSTNALLNGRRQGDYVTAAPAPLAGFWTPDDASPGRRWYRRADGSHPYIVGNTHYSFLSETDDQGRTLPGTIAASIVAQAPYFNKIRFSLLPCRYPHPTDKPFFDASGKPSDDGNDSLRPNPGWFHRRADVAVRACFDADVIADLILNGPDTPESRSALRSEANGGDPAPYLRYVAARYGSFANVWMCLANEWNIKTPRYQPQDIIRAAGLVRACLPYPTPLSVHGDHGDWAAALNTDPPWNDHVIVQGKIKRLDTAASFLGGNYAEGGRRMPVINDELGYEGAGDKFSREDVVEGHLGAFLGGGYGTTGHKPGNKQGHYFWGRFDAREHSAAASLGWMRKAIDRHIAFWQMAPAAPETMVTGVPRSARALAWEGREFVLGTREEARGLKAKLPAGVWSVRRMDVLAMTDELLSETAEGEFVFDVPASRAVLVHFKRLIGAVGFLPPPRERSRG
jgi:hypothetical protein